MAAAGKKSKKPKWVRVHITEVIAEPTAIPATQNWADSVADDAENYGGASSRPRAPMVLPSASRAARGGLAVDDESIPRRPPYVAHISNLPYDVDESAIMELFEGLKINNLRLPREGDRLKGYGDVDFEDRESLINAMNIADLTIGGRRVRIEVSTQDNDRRMGRSGRSDREREYDPERTTGDWRSGPRAMPDIPRGGSRPIEREGMRERERERESSADNKPGGWRDGDRPAAEPARTPYGGRDSYGRDRDRNEERYGGRERGYGRDGDRYGGRDSGGFGNRDRGFGSRGFGDRDGDAPREESKPRERPKLNLLPRTVPRETEIPTKPADGAPLDDKVPEKPVPKPVPAEKVFGAAKPVDTAAKEREIEERLRKQEEEARLVTEEKERWGRKNDHSGDRRGDRPSNRRDDRGRDSRSYNRDNRDYSKDDKQRRDNRDDKDRRDYSKEDRESSRDDRDKRDYSRDNREKRDFSRDDRDNRVNSRDGDRRDYSGDRRDTSGNRRDASGNRRDTSGNRRDPSSDRKADKPHSGDERETNGKDDVTRNSRSKDRHEDSDKPLPKMMEPEKPNFVGTNKFSFLEDDGNVSE